MVLIFLICVLIAVPDARASFGKGCLIAIVFLVGGFVRNVFEKTIERQSVRMADIPSPSVEKLSEIRASDVPALYT